MCTTALHLWGDLDLSYATLLWLGVFALGCRGSLDEKTSKSDSYDNFRTIVDNEGVLRIFASTSSCLLALYAYIMILFKP